MTFFSRQIKSGFQFLPRVPKNNAGRMTWNDRSIRSLDFRVRTNYSNMSEKLNYLQQFQTFKMFLHSVPEEVFTSEYYNFEKKISI